MNNFKRFLEKNKIRANAINKGNSSFIINGYNSTIIKNNDNIEFSAAIVNQQEKKSAYIYTNKEDVLDIGSAWEAKDLHFLIAEEITIIKDVNWHKYIAHICNVEINGLWGCFIGPEEKYINLTLQQTTVLTSEQKPILILPSNSLEFGDKIIIKNRAWLVQEFDNITTEGITYYSLRPTTISKNVEENSIEKNADKNVVIDENIKEIGENIYSVLPNTPITITTYKGYFEYDNHSIEVLEHKSNLVKFLIPIGINEVIINIKEGGNNNIVTKKYIIR